MPINMNSGYSGWSMSNNAVAAYEAGEMPRSKWTKKAMLSTIAAYCDKWDLVPLHDLAKLTKAELFDKLFKWTGWHHTSKLCNETDFYGLNEEALISETRELTGKELAAKREAKEQAQAEACAREEVRRKREADYYTEHGYRPDSLSAYMDAHPECCMLRISKRGTAVVDYTDPINGRTFTQPIGNAPSVSVIGFSAIHER